MRYSRYSEATAVGTREGERRSRQEKSLQESEADEEPVEGDCTWGTETELTQQCFKGTAKRDVQIFFHYHITLRTVKKKNNPNKPS